MEILGLCPSVTGKEGGAKTGPSCSHYIVEGGRFDVIEKNLDISIRFFRLDPPKKKAESKLKFECPECGIKAWGKPSLSILCGDCGIELEKGI